MVVIGFDQATKITGASVYKDGELISYKTLSCEQKGLRPFDRIKLMRKLVSEYIHEYKPQFVMFEGVQFQQNYQVYSQLSQLLGALYSICLDEEIAFQIIEPAAWRKKIGIKGRKREEQKLNAVDYVRGRFGIDVTDDVAEGILIGLCASDYVE